MQISGSIAWRLCACFIPFLVATPAELIEVVRDRRPLVEGTLVEVERVEELLARVGVLLVKSRLTMQEDES